MQAFAEALQAVGSADEEDAGADGATGSSGWLLGDGISARTCRLLGGCAARERQREPGAATLGSSGNPGAGFWQHADADANSELTLDEFSPTAGTLHETVLRPEPLRDASFAPVRGPCRDPTSV